MADGIEAILAEAEATEHVRTAVGRVLIRQDLHARHEALKDELARALADDELYNRPADAPRIAEEILELEAQIEQAKVEFRFRAIGRRRWADLLAANPPTKAQRLADPRADHNPATFPIVAIAASCEEPNMTEEQVRRLEAALNDSQFNVLWARCLDANVGGLTDPKVLGASGIAHRAKSPSGASATTADEQSLAVSSSDE